MLFNSIHTVPNQIRIGTRASRLAKKQAQEVKKEFIFKLGWDERDIILSEFTTTGDRVYDRPFRMIGDKGVFCKEIETAILAEKIDGGVHSLKDMPLDQPEGLVIAAYFKRENPYDTLITHKAKSIKDLPSNSSIGTSSIRRKLQIQRENKHINVIPIRGNIHTRLGIWKEGKVDGLVLASAGLNRMKFLGLPRYTVSDSILLPSPGQGTICFECRTYDTRIIEIVKRVSHKETEIAAKAERSFLASLGGDCDLPVGGLAVIKNNSVYLKGEFYSDKLERFIHGSRESEDVHAADSGKILADSLLEEETRSLALI